MATRVNRDNFMWKWLAYGRQTTEPTPLYMPADLVELGGEIYTCEGGNISGQHGNLYKWNAAKYRWEVQATGPTDYISILCVFDGNIYGAGYWTGPTDSLYEWSGGATWSVVAPTLGGQYVTSLCVFNNKLYGGTRTSGLLYEWNGVDAWAQVAGQYVAETQIYCLCVFNNKLYAGSSPNAHLLEWNGVDAWVLAATGPVGASTSRVTHLIEYDSKLFGMTLNERRLLEWDGDDEWIDRGAVNPGSASIHYTHIPKIHALDPGDGNGTRIYLPDVYNNALYSFDMAGNVSRLEGQFDSSCLSSPSYPVACIEHNSKLYMGQHCLFEYVEADKTGLRLTEPIIRAGYYEDSAAPFCTISTFAAYNGTMYMGVNGAAVLAHYDGTKLLIDCSIDPSHEEIALNIAELGFNGDAAYVLLQENVYPAGYWLIYEGDTSPAAFTLMTQPAASHHLRAIAVYNEKVYTAGDNGKLYEWSGSEWVEKADQINSKPIYELYVYNSKLYGGGGPNVGDAVLFEWNDVDAWVQVAPALNDGANTGRRIYSMCEYDGELYGVCYAGTGGYWLLKWNDVDAWTKIADLTGTASCREMTVHNSKLWWTGAGTYSEAYMYSYDGAAVDYEGFAVACNYRETQNCSLLKSGVIYRATHGQFQATPALENYSEGMLWRHELSDKHLHARPTMNEMPGYKPSQMGGVHPDPYKRVARKGQAFDWTFKLTENWDNATPQTHFGRLTMWWSGTPPEGLQFFVNEVDATEDIGDSLAFLGQGWFKAVVNAGYMQDDYAILRAIVKDRCFAEDVVYTY